MKNKIQLFLLSILCLLMSCASRQNFGTEFIPEDSTKTEYSSKSPCEVKMVINLPEENTQYKLIGICKVRKLARKKLIGKEVVNRAAKGLEDCACKHGGDIVKIIKHDENKERFGTTPSTNGNGTTRNSIDGPGRRLYDDSLIGEVYQKIAR